MRRQPILNGVSKKNRRKKKRTSRRGQQGGGLPALRNKPKHPLIMMVESLKDMAVNSVILAPSLLLTAVASLFPHLLNNTVSNLFGGYLKKGYLSNYNCSIPDMLFNPSRCKIDSYEDKFVDSVTGQVIDNPNRTVSLAKLSGGGRRRTQKGGSDVVGDKNPSLDDQVVQQSITQWFSGAPKNKSQYLENAMQQLMFAIQDEPLVDKLRATRLQHTFRKIPHQSTQFSITSQGGTNNSSSILLKIIILFNTILNNPQCKEKNKAIKDPQHKTVLNPYAVDHISAGSVYNGTYTENPGERDYKDIAFCATTSVWTDNASQPQHGKCFDKQTATTFASVKANLKLTYMRFGNIFAGIYGRSMFSTHTKPLIKLFTVCFDVLKTIYSAKPMPNTSSKQMETPAGVPPNDHALMLSIKNMTQDTLFGDRRDELNQHLEDMSNHQNMPVENGDDTAAESNVDKLIQLMPELQMKFYENASSNLDFHFGKNVIAELQELICKYNIMNAVIERYVLSEYRVYLEQLKKQKELREKLKVAMYDPSKTKSLNEEMEKSNRAMLDWCNGHVRSLIQVMSCESCNKDSVIKSTYMENGMTRHCYMFDEIQTD
jgi:hypothetical protein